MPALVAACSPPHRLPRPTGPARCPVRPGAGVRPARLDGAVPDFGGHPALLFRTGRTRTAFGGLGGRSCQRRTPPDPLAGNWPGQPLRRCGYRQLGGGRAAAGRRSCRRKPQGWPAELRALLSIWPIRDCPAARRMASRSRGSSWTTEPIPTRCWIGPWGEPAFTVLTGPIGEGEGYQPPHPQAKDLATLLIERGADPFDPQALYNTSITQDDTGWLEFLWSQSERHGRLDAWRVAEGALIGGNVLDYLLGNGDGPGSSQTGGMALGAWCGPNSLHAYSKRPPARGSTDPRPYRDGEGCSNASARKPRR